MALGSVKSSTVFIAIGDTTRVYRSVDEVPLPLRKRLVESTNSLNSATILIADHGGREEFTRPIRGLPASVQSRLLDALIGENLDAKPPRPVAGLSWQYWAGILSAGAIVVLLWILFTTR